MNKPMFLLVCCAVVVMVAFFLPWFRALPEDAIKDPMKMKERVLAYEPSLVWDYILIRGRDLSDMQLPTDGVSGFQMAFSRSARPQSQIVSQYLFGTERLDWRVTLFVVSPILALFSFLIFMKGEAPIPWWMGLAAAQFVFYLVMRLLLTQGQLIHMEMILGLGLWLTLYGTLILSVANFFLALQKRK